MKRFSKTFISIASLGMLFSIASCGNSETPMSEFERKTRDIYESGLREGSIQDQTYEQWLESIKGKDGKDGNNGQDGHTPVIVIGANGNWFIDDVDTGISAQGPKGEQGNPGKDGVSVVSITKTGSEGNVDTYAIRYSDGNTSTFTVTNGVDGQSIKGDPGKDGHTPEIKIVEGYWTIDGVSTGILAQGPQGDPGKDGVSVLSITKTSSDGNVDTYTISYSDGSTSTFTVTNGVDGESIKGDPGKDGHTPDIKIIDGYWTIDGEKTSVPAQGPQGDPGLNGNSILTGSGNPQEELGVDGDSYINLSTWDYYLKEESVWILKGNIKGSKGDAGVSISSTYIDDNGDLIVTFSNDEVVNAGHIKDVDTYTVKFYCDDLLVDTQSVKHGDKIKLPELEDFTIKHWYLDKEFEYEWLWYGCVVTEDMALYGKYTTVEKQLSFSKDNMISIDEYGFGEAIDNDRQVCVSKAVETVDYLTTLEDRGILFNKEEIGLIKTIKVDVDTNGFSSAKLFYGNTPLSFDYFRELFVGENTIDLSGHEYFTIQNTGNDSINIESLNIVYERKTHYVDNDLPTVVINTKNEQAVTSRTEYVSCTVSTVGAEKDVSDLKAEIKVRGNSTSKLPKKPYRIKLNKKNSLFGYEKAKNWVLLADYMDGSNVHNYTALKFAKMVRGDGSFGFEPLHVNVVLNGENIGIYIFGEHIDAKEGRLNIEQDKLWEKSFDEINFYIERDLSTASDPTEIEGETYFKVNMEDYSVSQYVFALKYPEKEDFEEELENDEVDTHEEEFQSFFNSLKEYMTTICNSFVTYSKDTSNFSNISSLVDVNSLAEYAVTDQAFREIDHSQKSYKMYRNDGGLLKFGPNWDYDSCSYGLPYTGTYILNPFEVGLNKFESLYVGDKWGYMLFNDSVNGKPLFKAIWDNISSEMIEGFIVQQDNEMKSIAESTVYDCEKWMNNQYYCVFDNQQYYWKYINTQLQYLKSFYDSL